jgi:membrane-associated HD superfamily phosphohydrolase
MKALIIALVSLGTLPRAFAIFGVGDVVYDPVNNGVLVETKVETLAQWASALAKAETQIQNQLQQIQRAESLLNTQNQIRLGIGDWQSIVSKAQSIQLQAANLTKDNNQGISASFVVTTGQPSLGYTNHGDFDPVPTSDAFGNTVSVPDDRLKRYAAVEAVYEKALTTLQATETEAQQNNQEIADAYQAMTQAGVTQQEYTKLQGKIQTLSVRQQALQSQRQDALAMVQAEQTINQNQQMKEDSVNGGVQESNQQAVTNGLAQTQFDVLSWQ